MEEFPRSKVQLQRVTDDKLRQEMFSKRKQALVKKAMELSVLCDCDVGLIIFGPGATGPGAGGQRLTQYSSTSMDELLERYAAAVAEPHERRRNGELLRHYYELSPDEDEEETGRNGDGTASTSAAAAAAAATMAAVDSIILGGGGRRMDGAPNFVKRMRLHSPGLGPGGGPLDVLQGMGMPARTMTGIAPAPGPGAGPPAGMLGNGILPTGQQGASAPLRRVGAVGGPPLPLEGIKAAGFLDKCNYPLSPRSETAFEEITAEFDKLAELRNQRTGTGGRQTTSTVLQPMGASAPGPGFSLASHQHHLQQILLQQQQLLQQRQQQQQQGGGAKRFKPLSILVPELQTHPIIPTNLTPLNATSASGAGPYGAQGSEQPHGGANGVDPHRHPQQQPQPTSPFDGSLQHQHMTTQQQQPGASLPQSGGLPPRPPLGRLGAGLRPQHQGSVALAMSTGRGLSGSATSPGPIAISPTSGAGGPGFGGPGEGAPMDVDGGAAAGGGGGGGGFGLDRRSVGMLGDDALGSLMGASAFRTSLDGSAANLLAIPSPPPHGGAHSLFGSLDGGPLSMRSSSHGMLGSLSSLDRGPSLGLGGLGMSLESPGGPMGLDTALRGLAPMDVLDWPSMSPRSSTGNGDGPGSSDGGGGFPDEGEGEGGTVLDGLIVRGTALSKLAPEALEAAIGSSPDSVGISGAPGGSVRARMSLSAFGTGPSTAAAEPDGAAASASPVRSGGQQQQQQGNAAAQNSPGSPNLGRQDAGPGSSSSPAGSKPRTPGEAGQAAAGNEVGMSGAGSMGLLPEMSLSDLVHGGPGSIAAAAAAAVAAVDAQQAVEGKGEGQGTVGLDIGLGLEVVGKALVIPNGARGNGAQNSESGRGSGGGALS